MVMNKPVETDFILIISLRTAYEQKHSGPEQNHIPPILKIGRGSGSASDYPVIYGITVSSGETGMDPG